MKPMFKSKFSDIDSDTITTNAELLSGGKQLYKSHIQIMKLMELCGTYMPIQDIYANVGIQPFIPMSKRKIYTQYESGVVVGAGSGNDCDDLLDNTNFVLIDLEDCAMRNFAAGYDNTTTQFNLTEDPDGSTLVEVDSRHKTTKKDIEVKTIDSLELSQCDLLSIDAEGTGLDVLSGAKDTIAEFHPNILVGIYHNWVEYLLIPPMLYDMGYSLFCMKTTNLTPEQPQLELAILAVYKGVDHDEAI